MPAERTPPGLSESLPYGRGWECAGRNVTRQSVRDRFRYYRVPPERIALFAEKWPEFDFAAFQEESTLDLALINQQFLENCGFRPEQIDNARVCTACHHTDFYSFRRERATGRMLSLIVMK